MKRPWKLTLLISFLALTACGSLTKHKDEAALTTVKKVAVVAYKATLPTSASLGFNAGSGKLQAEAGGSMLTNTSPQTDKMLTDFHASLKRQLGWDILDLQKMKSTSSYMAAYKQTMEGWQNKMPTNQGEQAYLVDGIMDTDGPRLLDVDGRDKLMRDLGVDAIVLADVNVFLDGTTVMGIGSRKPKASVNLQLYTKGSDRAVWFETFEGEASNESVGSTHFIDETKLKDLAVASAQTAYAKLGTKN